MLFQASGGVCVVVSLVALQTWNTCVIVYASLSIWTLAAAITWGRSAEYRMLRVPCISCHALCGREWRDHTMKGKGATSKAGQAASQKTLRKAVGAAVNEALKLQVLFARAVDTYWNRLFVLVMLNIRTWQLYCTSKYLILRSMYDTGTRTRTPIIINDSVSWYLHLLPLLF